MCDHLRPVEDVAPGTHRHTAMALYALFWTQRQGVILLAKDAPFVGTVVEQLRKHPALERFHVKGDGCFLNIDGPVCHLSAIFVHGRGLHGLDRGRVKGHACIG
jgi:hypothetical protein